MPSLKSQALAAMARVRRRPVLWLSGTLLLGALLALGGWVLAQRAQRAWQDAMAQLSCAMEADTQAGYREVVRVGERLLRLHPQEQGVAAHVAYAATILAVEYQQADMLGQSRRYLDVAGKSSVQTLCGEALAARILALYGDGELQEGIALAQAAADRGAGGIMPRLEALRLVIAARAKAPAPENLVQQLAQEVTHEARVLVVLGMWSLTQLNTAQAGQYFAQALRVSPDHPQALLGAAWVPLFAPQPSANARWQAQRQAGLVLRLPPTSLTPPVQAMALLLRAWVAELEGDGPTAQRDRSEALQLAPDHLLHDVDHEGPGRP